MLQGLSRILATQEHRRTLPEHRDNLVTVEWHQQMELSGSTLASTGTHSMLLSLLSLPKVCA